MAKVSKMLGGNLHIETELGIVNIYEGLKDVKGRKVNTIQVMPDEYSGENKVKATPVKMIRLIQLKTTK